MRAKIRYMNKLYKILLTLFFIVPTFVLAAPEYTPIDVAYIFLDTQDSDNEYKLVIENKDGELHRIKEEVSFTGTRYQLFEDIARVINDHRYFTGFDDDDMTDLVWGIAPFSADEISDIRTRFSQEDNGDFLTVYVEFNTGDVGTKKVEVDQTFTSSADVSSYVANVVNSMDGFKEGEVDTQMVENLHSEAYTGLSYFTPQLDLVEFEYLEEEQRFTVNVQFANMDEDRSFDLAFDVDKEQLIKDATDLINDLYVEYEDAKFNVQKISSHVSWRNTPWMINDIEEIHIASSSDDLVSVEFTVKSRISNTLIGTTILSSTNEELDITNIDALAKEAKKLLEEHQLFAHEFPLSSIRNEIAETNDEFADQVESTSEKSSGDTSSDKEASTQEDDSSSESVDETENKDALYQLLLIAILEFIAENGLDIDTSDL